jgi:peptidoglycan hydrolase CwlO-like protein
MTDDAELHSKLAERDDVIRQLVARLRETVDENDQLRAALARQTEGASAYATLSDTTAICRPQSARKQQSAVSSMSFRD